MSSKCNRCKEKITGDSDHYSETWIAFRDKKMDRATKVTVSVDNTDYDYPENCSNKTLVGNLCKKCFMELLEEASLTFKKHISKI